jgi:lipopolysaccharide export system permease protein
MLRKRPWKISPHLIIFVLKEIMPTFVLGTGIFLFIMLMFQAIRLSEFLVVHQVGLVGLVKISAYLLLSFLPIAVPIAFLFAVLMGTSRIQSEGEVLALQASGISLKQIYLPYILLATVVTGLCTYWALYTVPRGNRAFELIITKVSGEKVISQMRPGVFQEGFFGLVILAESITPLKNEMRKVFIYDQREENQPVAISAKAGILRSDPQGEHQLTLRLSDGTIYLEQLDPKGPQKKIEFDVYDINLDVGSPGGGWRDYSPPSYNFNQLRQRLREIKPDTPAYRQLLVETHRRFSLSFACLVFSALGFAIGLISQRGIRSTAVILCLLLATVYWLSYIGANSYALTGGWAPWIGVWAPNVVFAFLSWWLYARFARK